VSAEKKVGGRGFLPALGGRAAIRLAAGRNGLGSPQDVERATM